MAIQRFDNGPRMSRAVVHGDTVYLAGLTAEKTAGQSVGEQTKEILGRIDGYLKQAGTDKSKLLQAVIWLQDVRTVDEFNKEWDAWVVPGSGPARACIEARLQSPAKMIEIQGDGGEVARAQSHSVSSRAWTGHPTVIRRISVSDTMLLLLYQTMIHSRM